MADPWAQYTESGLPITAAPASADAWAQYAQPGVPAPAAQAVLTGDPTQWGPVSQAANAAMFGLGPQADEWLNTHLPAFLTGGQQHPSAAQEQANANAWAQQNPKSATAAGLVGGAIPYVVGGEAMGPVGLLPRMLGMGGIGVAQQALPVAANGGSPEEINSAANLGALTGAGAELGGAALGKLTNALTTRLGLTANPTNIPTRPQLKAGENSAYDAVRNTGAVYDPYEVSASGEAVRQDPTFPHPSLARNTHAIMDSYINVPSPGANPTVPIDNLMAAREQLGAVANSADNPKDAFAAKRAIAGIDSFIANPPPGAVLGGNAIDVAGLYGTARANAAARFRGDELASVAQQADRGNAVAHSGGNEGNTIRQKLRNFVNANAEITGYEPGDYRLPGYTGEEKDTIDTLMQGTPAQNLARSLGKQFGAGGGIGTWPARAAGAALGYHLGGEGGMAAGMMLPEAIRTGARTIDDYYARQGLKGLIDSTLARSPLGAQMATQPLAAPSIMPDAAGRLTAALLASRRAPQSQQ